MAIDREGAPERRDVAREPDGAALADLTATRDELTVKLGDQIVSLGYRSRGRHKSVVRPLAECAARLLASPSGGAYRLAPALIANPDGDGLSSRDMPEPVVIRPPEARVAILTGAEVSAGVITAANGRTVAESLAGTETLDRFGPFTWDARGFLHQAKPRFSVQRRLHGAPAVLLKTGPSPLDRPLTTHGRWLVETLPRLALVEDHFDLRRLTFIVDAAPASMRAIQEDSLALFGIRPEQIVEVGDETVFVDELVYPTPLATMPSVIAPRCVEVLEQLATRVRANPVGARRFFVRDAAIPMSPREDADIVATVERHGFTVVEPETLTLYQRIGLFRRADVVVGSPGPALVNALFSTQDLTLIVLAPPAWREATWHAAYESLMSLKTGRYIVVPSRADPGSSDADAAPTIDRRRLDLTLAAVVGGGP